jgi:hypothetical protein
MRAILLIRLVLGSALLFLSASSVHADVAATPHSNLALWYNQPARQWVEALPIGNGRMGAMVFGGVDRERLQLNEDTLWSGEPPADLRSLNITGTYDHVVGLLRSNRHAEADVFVQKHWLGRNQQCYQPLGDLHLGFSGSGEVTEYRRWLDLKTATAGVSFRREGVKFTREIFASHPDQVIVIHLRTDKPGALAFTAGFSSVHPTAKTNVAGGELVTQVAGSDEKTEALLFGGMQTVRKSFNLRKRKKTPWFLSENEGERDEVDP